MSQPGKAATSISDAVTPILAAVRPAFRAAAMILAGIALAKLAGITGIRGDVLTFAAVAIARALV